MDRRDPELKEYIKLLFRRSWFIALIAMLFCGLAYVQDTLYGQPSYEASSRIIVNTSKKAEEAGSVDLNQITSDIMLIDTYKEIINTPAILDRVVADHPEFGITVAELDDKIKVSSSSRSQVMSITVRDPSAAAAVAIVNAVAETFKEEVPKLLRVDNVTVLTKADLSNQPPNVSISLLYKVVIAFALSAMVSITLVFLWEYLDDSIRTEQDVAQYLGKRMLADVPRIRRKEMKVSSVKERRKVAGDPVHVGINQQI